jgi:pilus assembly protein Flp/PilA
LQHFEFFALVLAQRARESSMQKIISFLRNQAGASSIEYALLAAGVAATIIVVVNGLGSSVNNEYTSVATALK